MIESIMILIAIAIFYISNTPELHGYVRNVIDTVENLPKIVGYIGAFILVAPLIICPIHLLWLDYKWAKLSSEEKEKIKSERKMKALQYCWNKYPKCNGCEHIKSLEGEICCRKSRCGGSSHTVGFDNASGYESHVTYLNLVSDLKRCPENKW